MGSLLSPRCSLALVVHVLVAPTSPVVQSMLDNLRPTLPPSTFPPEAIFEVKASRRRENGDLTEKHLLHDPATGVYLFVFSFSG